MPLDEEETRVAFARKARQYERANVRITQILNDLLDDLSDKYGVREGLTVMGEPKPFESFYRKATEKYECETVDEAFEKVRDLSRVRVVCQTLDDCYQLLELLRAAQEVVYVDETSIEDRIGNPSRTGYRAIHLEVRVDVSIGDEMVGVPVEVQIRSSLQEAWGHFTHGDFYHAEAAPELIATLMQELSTLLYWADRHAALLVREIAKADDGSESERDKAA